MEDNCTSGGGEQAQRRRSALSLWIQPLPKIQNKWLALIPASLIVVAATTLHFICTADRCAGL